MIVAEDNSSVTYVENYISTVACTGTVFNLVTEVVANANAKVQYGAVDNLAKGITTYVNRRGTAGRDAKIGWSLGLMNDGNTISKIQQTLLETVLPVMRKLLLLELVIKYKTSQPRLYILAKTRQRIF